MYPTPGGATQGGGGLLLPDRGLVALKERTDEFVPLPYPRLYRLPLLPFPLVDVHGGSGAMR